MSTHSIINLNALEYTKFYHVLSIQSIAIQHLHLFKLFKSIKLMSGTSNW